MPFGGRYQMTPIQPMVATLPVTEGETTTVSGMSYGFHPQVMAQSPYEGAYLSVVAVSYTHLAHDVGMVVLAGFMLILDACVIRAYEGRILNVHPSLIPAFCGGVLRATRCLLYTSRCV